MHPRKYLFRVVLLIILSMGFSDQDRPTWRGYYEACGNQSVMQNEFFSRQEIADMKLWANLSSEVFGKGALLYGAKYGLQEIFRNQNPSNCSEATFLISNGYIAGFGARLHTEVIGLTIAMELGRVYLPRNDNKSLTWETSSRHCTSRLKNNLNCFYESWSKCSIADAIKGVSKIDDLFTINTYRDIPMDFFINPSAASDYRNSLSGHSAVLIDLDWRIGSYEAQYKIIPYKLSRQLECGPVAREARYLWWRSIAITYLLRPNAETLQLIAQNRQVSINNTNPCISVYIRHGDKKSEMKLIQTDQYWAAVEFLVHEGFLPGYNGSANQTYKGTIFLGTDDPQALQDTVNWGQVKGYDIQYTKILDRSEQLKHQAAVPGTRSELEYISYLVNLEYALKCEAWVCTLGSNTCGIIDDMRVTVAGKSNRAFLDLSTETCSSPPCWSFRNSKF